MKKVISLILTLVLCLSCCLAFVACSDEDKNTSVSPGQAEAAKQSFLSLIETYNGLITIYGTEMNITADTTIQSVVDFVKTEGGQTVAVEHLDTSRHFLDACQKGANGYYELRTDVDWSNYYKA